MPRNPILVTLSLGSEPYQKRLPPALLRQGMLRRVLRFEPSLEVLDPNGPESLKVVRRFPEYNVIRRILWAGWRRLPGTGCSRLPVAANTWLADRLASGYVPPSSIFHGLCAVCLACLEAAKRQGAITMVQNPTLHLQQWQDEVMAECKHFGINPRNCGAVLPTSVVHRTQREYELCDRIIVLSSVARRSFERFGLAHKTAVVWPGVDHLFFSPSLEPRLPRLFRVCYVGRVELAKGVGYLLQAWKRLGLPQAELLLVGESQPEMAPLLRNYASASVRMAGALPAEAVAESYRESSVFVLPSVNEGLGLVLLEAMACGLPVVGTEKTGVADCITEGKEGFVIAARNVDALAEVIFWCYQHHDETMAMGRAAREKIERQFTLAHYEDRQIALYRSVFGTG